MVALQASATPDADLARSLTQYRRVVHYRRFDIQAVAASYYEVHAFPYVVQLALERAEKMEEVLQKQQRDKTQQQQQQQQQPASYSKTTITSISGSEPYLYARRHSSRDGCAF